MNLDDYLGQLDLCYFEVTEAFKGLAAEHVWVRPATGLLSVGELAGHVAYWEAVRFAGRAEDGSSARDLSTCKITSPLLDARFAYYTTNTEIHPNAAHLAMSAQQVQHELLRVHHEAMDCLKGRDPDLTMVAPYWSPQSNYGELLKYVAFHIAYHTGQMYSVRHLLGEETPDN